MIKSESKRLKEIWTVKAKAYREVSKSRTVEEMISKRIQKINKATNAINFGKVENNGKKVKHKN